MCRFIQPSHQKLPEYEYLYLYMYYVAAQALIRKSPGIQVSMHEQSLDVLYEVPCPTPLLSNDGFTSGGLYAMLT